MGPHRLEKKALQRYMDIKVMTICIPWVSRVNLVPDQSLGITLAVVDLQGPGATM